MKEKVKENERERERYDLFLCICCIKHSVFVIVKNLCID